MSNFYTRRDIMNTFHISRRVIEGYEEIELIKPTKSNDRGGLLYDQYALNRIGFIRLCQRMGFELKDVAQMINLPSNELKKRLNNQTKLISSQIDNLNYLLKIMDCLIKNIEDPRNSEKIVEIFKEEKI